MVWLCLCASYHRLSWYKFLIVWSTGMIQPGKMRADGTPVALWPVLLMSCLQAGWRLCVLLLLCGGASSRSASPHTTVTEVGALPANLLVSLTEHPPICSAYIIANYTSHPTLCVGRIDKMTPSSSPDSLPTFLFLAGGGGRGESPDTNWIRREHNYSGTLQLTVLSTYFLSS